MTAHGALRPNTRHKAGGFFMLPFALVGALVLTAGSFVAYVLWPSWPTAPVALDAPAIPITVAGVLFDVPPAAIRAAVQRHPGAHERIDLAFLWPSLTPPGADSEAAVPGVPGEDGTSPSPGADHRLFVAIAGLDGLLVPQARLRAIYPRYIETQAAAGPGGLAIVAFRAGTPYEGEDLVYVADEPERFFARCSRPVRTVPGICIHERALDAAEITLRFPRAWLDDWRNVAAGFDRLVAQLHPSGG